MKLVVALICVSITAFVFFYDSFLVNQKTADAQNLNTAILTISRLIEQNNIGELEKFVAETPDVFIQKYYNAVKASENISDTEFQNLQKKSINEFTIEPYRRNFSSKSELIEYALPSLKLINEKKLKFIQVVDISQNGDEAKAIVCFGISDSINSNYELLLYRYNDGWKTFSFKSNDLSRVYDNKFGEPSY